MGDVAGRYLKLQAEVLAGPNGAHCTCLVSRLRKQNIVRKLDFFTCHLVISRA